MNIRTVQKKVVSTAVATLATSRFFGAGLVLGIALYFIASAAMGFYSGLYGLAVPTPDTSALESHIAKFLPAD